ncbi:hypothetical protein D1872_246420 [compost metagenome]
MKVILFRREVFLKDDMGISPTGSKGRYPGDSRVFPLLAVLLHYRTLPFRKPLLDYKWRFGKVYIRVQFLGMQARGNFPVFHLQDDFSDACNPCGRL